MVEKQRRSFRSHFTCIGKPPRTMTRIASAAARHGCGCAVGGRPLKKSAA
jgi:hypothetical protein